MALPKRKRVDVEDEESTGSDFLVVPAEDDDIDISSALTGIRPPLANTEGDIDESELEEFIRDSITKRDAKGGTKVLKKLKSKAQVGGGSFQSMGVFVQIIQKASNIFLQGLHPSLLRALSMQGYRTPTPIQRATIPSVLTSPPRDLVGMARTGSGKTLAYMIPLVQRLSGRHSHAFGTRAITLVPARELALQVLRVGKALVKNWRGDAGHHAGDGTDDEDDTKVGKGEALRWGLVVGGEDMNEQFEMVRSNPDMSVPCSHPS